MKLISYEHYLLNILQDFTDQLQDKVNTIENYLQMMEYEEDDQLPTNPIEYFRLIRRLHLDYLNWVWYLEQQPWEGLVSNINAIAPEMPSTTDIEEATSGLKLIQRVYSLPTHEMVEGIFQGIHHNTSLNPMECYTIANDLFKEKDFVFALEWLSVGAQMYMADKDNEDLYTQLGVPLVNFIELFVQIQDALGERSLAMTELETAMETWPDQASLGRAHSRLKMSIRIGEESKISKEVPLGVYEYCCTLECRPNLRLFCQYNTTASSFLRLAPLKMELLSLDPYVVLYHDVVSEKDIASIKMLAQNNLTRAQTFNPNRTLAIDPFRTTKGRWINEMEGVMHRMSQLTEDMTNLDLNGSELFQVMNYGIGGFYGTHYDFLGTPNHSKWDFSDRMVTSMIYLSDVPLGGATIFPELELSVFPKKGSALIWYNLNHKGEGDTRTAHSACPTIVGSRWVMTKWIREHPQMFRRPCQTKRDRFE
ncbi:prolyl 4-hydroxylase subunit alpha-2 isoform X2 [Drosophila rhopaloa]|uniref:procollagen-proline 4-dioxygenase n=1 Tax=Drosophila rhopaloa TaxID=1041015 RepID=A0ABM5HI44_DRORH|nr:prolyl 4-hydroxylase subunit alpha-2 isoform X2 [Drosophila rhopaloa]